MNYHLLSICVFRLFLTKPDAKSIDWQRAKAWTVRNGDLSVQEVPVPPPPKKKEEMKIIIIM